MNNSNDKTCENCEFYLQHYYRSTQGYKETLGHCLNDKLKPVFSRKCFTLQRDCKYWQPADNEQLQQGLKTNLQALAKRLDAVCEVLLDEEKQ